ncbi:UNVERIFIED_ORG: hypothetical protein B2H93_13410 [Clostridium botulinum]
MNEKEYLDYIEEWKKQNKELIDSGKCRKVFLECLPKGGKSKMGVGKSDINWEESIGYNIYFIYNDVEDSMQILDYRKNNQELIIKYRKEHDIKTSVIKKNGIGRIVGEITSDFRYEIGQILKDENKDIIVIDRKYEKQIKTDRFARESIANRKYYKYRCNKCGFDCGEHYDLKTNVYKKDFWRIEYDLINSKQCACCGCSNQIVVEGINDIPTTASWMLKYFQGGYDEAKKYTKGSSKKIYPVCPNCGRIKDKDTVIRSIYKNHSIGCICEDTVSFPEKFMFNVLEQLGVDSMTQLTRKIFKWCKDYRYDFYFELNNEEYIIETHGLQHYEEKKGSKWDKLKEIKTNDILKKDLALKNGVKEENYIVIDCRKSELEFIKQNVLNSRLNELFDLSNIDWLKVEEYSYSNLVKQACKLKKKHPEMTTTQIGEIMSYSHGTITKWLTQGDNLGWCNYNTAEIMKNVGKKNGQLNKREIICTTTGEKFKSINFCAKNSLKIFGVKMCPQNISKVCNGLRLHTFGYCFEFLEKSKSEDIRIKQQKKKLKEEQKTKPIICLTNGLVISSATKCAKNSKELFGVNLPYPYIYEVCNKKRKDAKGFCFKYVKDLSEEECIKYNIKK